jgi:hypothetical protein
MLEAFALPLFMSSSLFVESIFPGKRSPVSLKITIEVSCNHQQQKVIQIDN